MQGRSYAELRPALVRRADDEWVIRAGDADDASSDDGDGRAVLDEMDRPDLALDGDA